MSCSDLRSHNLYLAHPPLECNLLYNSVSSCGWLWAWSYKQSSSFCIPIIPPSHFLASSSSLYIVLASCFHHSSNLSLVYCNRSLSCHNWSSCFYKFSRSCFCSSSCYIWFSMTFSYWFLNSITFLKSSLSSLIAFVLVSISSSSYFTLRSILFRSFFAFSASFTAWSLSSSMSFAFYSRFSIDSLLCLNSSSNYFRSFSTSFSYFIYHCSAHTSSCNSAIQAISSFLGSPGLCPSVAYTSQSHMPSNLGGAGRATGSWSTIVLTVVLVVVTFLGVFRCFSNNWLYSFHNLSTTSSFSHTLSSTSVTQSHRLSHSWVNAWF